MCDWPNRETAMTVIRWNDENPPRPTIWCDPCLEPLIRALNDGGIPTAASCCGHGRRPGMVMLTDGRELLLLPDYEVAREFDGLWPGINHGAVDEGQVVSEPALLVLAKRGAQC